MSDEEEQETLLCCLCGFTIEHEMFPNGGYWGNNPAPFEGIKRHGGRIDDRCCDWCDSLKVSPARMGLTGEDAEKMGRALIQVKAIQMHMMQKDMQSGNCSGGV